MKKSFLIALLVGTTFVITTGCSLFTNGKVKEEEIFVEKDKAKKLDVKLNLDAGEMAVTNGAKNWVEGNIEYSDKRLRPKVSYELHSSKGEVLIKQPKKRLQNIGIGKRKNDWNIELNNEIPLNLDVEAGASKTELDLKGLNLKSLDIDNGVGELKVDLGGNWEHSFETKINTGVGKTTIILPSDIGVKINSNKGIGKANAVNFISKGNGVYVNEAYENGNEILTINMNMGVGEVTFKIDK